MHEYLSDEWYREIALQVNQEWDDWMDEKLSKSYPLEDLNRVFSW